MCLHRLLDGLDHPPYPCQPLDQQFVLAAQMRGGVGVRVVDEVRDLVEGEAELAVEHDLLQPLQIVLAVAAVAGRRAVARRQQSDLVVVVQGPHRDAGERGDLSYRVAHRFLLGLDARP